MDRKLAEYNLKKAFGFDQFYDEQWEAISRVLNGERILMIQKTGFGKSLCFQFPATQMQGLTIIFSPLIALMRDQVKSLKSKGIKAAAINSEELPEDNYQNLEEAVRGNLSMLYIAPERLGDNQFMETIKKMNTNVSLVVIDEAHCISVWGHDFRPDYRRILNLIKVLPVTIPIIATTATATKRTEGDILKQIGGRMTVVRGNLLRENFQLYVTTVKSEDEKMKFIAQQVSRIDGTGIIYTGTRVNTEIYSKWLNYIGISSIGYNAGLDTEKRIEIEQGLITNRWKVIVSTNALGMGIDKPDLRFVIHTQIPQSMIHYYQEIGRVGRDGKKSEIILLYDNFTDENTVEEDLKLPLSFIENARPSISQYNKVINAIKEEPLSESEIMRKTNLRQQQVRVIKSDLIDQKIATEINDNKTKKLEFRFGAPDIDRKPFDDLKSHKKEELFLLRDYIKSRSSRMNYLCTYLGDVQDENIRNCDNTNLSKLKYFESVNIESQLIEFWDNFFPIISMAPETSLDKGKYLLSSPFWTKYELKINNLSLGKLHDPKMFLALITAEDKEQVESRLIKKHLEKAKITDVVATSYYSYPKVGNAIRKSKYQNGGDFPIFLVERMERAYCLNLLDLKIDLVLFIPPTESGQLVENLSKKLGDLLNLPVLNIIKKAKNTQPQKLFENKYLKADNVNGAFVLFDSNLIVGKRILLIDDVIDSGATIKEVSKLLHINGAELIAPMVLAKTVGGDQL